ncbi:MAG: hypothetical protein, partial [Olavius algarvensis Gamma 1 endosymbiont]
EPIYSITSKITTTKITIRVYSCLPSWFFFVVQTIFAQPSRL